MKYGVLKGFISHKEIKRNLMIGDGQIYANEANSLDYLSQMHLPFTNDSGYFRFIMTLSHPYYYAMSSYKMKRTFTKCFSNTIFMMSLKKGTDVK